jgi:hypothetical protein
MADSTAVRVALWRAMHVQVDAPPHVLEDEIGLRLADPEDGWRDRGDMHPAGTAPFRAWVVVRARFIEDLVKERMRSTSPARRPGSASGWPRLATRTVSGCVSYPSTSRRTRGGTGWWIRASTYLVRRWWRPSA